MGNTERNHSKQDIENRINWAMKDTNDYSKVLERYAEAKFYTDLLGKEETYNEVCLKLGLSRRCL